MNGFIPIALLALAGILFGGAYSLYKQGASRWGIGLVGLLGLISAGGGLLWLL